MFNFLFVESNGNATLTLTANNYEEALEQLAEKVKDVGDWDCEDESGEEK